MLGISVERKGGAVHMKTSNEVIFRAPDLGAVRAYYAEHLGLPVVLEEESMVGFDTGTFNMYFERGEPHGAVFEFIVENLARAKEEFIAARCELLEEDPEIPRIYLRDPFGLIFNITEA
jgi:catechol 2,3-dioxygenase-like lactoylglutathione lyase family enzyme